MDDLRSLFKSNYLKYASYVILDRAIPDVVDGLKPVQRRILQTLFLIDDGKLHKVANVVGQTMALHPHGDAPIYEALVNLAAKEFFLDMQGNFGNIYTGDPAAAARYIETRLSQLAKDTLFNEDLTHFIPSYDGRNKEPTAFPAKIPVLLMLGAEGIAVGMSTKILPHNFKEVLEAEIALLEGRPYTLYPDFPTAGIMDASDYNGGQGKVTLRARIETRDDKTLIIKDICFGTTTESLIRTIDEAAKKGKIKIESINDYTAEKVEIEIKLPRGQHADDVIKALYAFTDCQVVLHSQFLVIRDKLPWETNVDEVLKYHSELLQGYLKTELELESSRLLEKIFEKTLEQIFIENRLYKKIEAVGSYDAIHTVIQQSLEPFHSQLSRIPTADDRERLLNIPIRRISRFDMEKNQDDIKALNEKLVEIEKQLKNIKKVAIKYLQSLIQKYAKEYPRLTEVQSIEVLDVKAIATKQVRVGYDETTGMLGTKVASNTFVECTNFDKLLIVYQNGTFTVINIPEKQYIHLQDSLVVWLGPADKKSVLNVIYKDDKTLYPYAKRFIVKQFILDKIYSFLEESTTLEFISSRDEQLLKILYKPKAKQKVSAQEFKFKDISVKGITAKGIRLSTKEFERIQLLQNESSD